jgi:ABC-type transport system substrate-binding protein
MKLKLIFLLSIIVCIVCVVFAAGCLNNDSNTLTSVNLLNKNIEPYESTFPENVPRGEDVIMHCAWTNYSIAGPHSNESLILNSDVVFYGTVTNIGSAWWATPDQKTPSNFDNPQFDTTAFKFKKTYVLKNGTEVVFNAFRIPGDELIYTPVTFEINDLVKGKNMTTVTINITGGQVDNYVLDEESFCFCYPSVWDLKEGQEYLVYLKNYDDEDIHIMSGGLFVVLD